MAVTRALLPFIPSDGAIVVTSSMQGKMALPYRSAYGASKHAVQVRILALTHHSPIQNCKFVHEFVYSPEYVLRREFRKFTMPVSLNRGVSFEEPY